MLDIARENLKEFSGIEFKLEDFYYFSFKKDYDAVVSSLALHHILSDNSKKDIYRKIFALLKENCFFFNFDTVSGANHSIQRIYMDAWLSFLKKMHSQGEIDDLLTHHYREEYIATLQEQIDWLKNIGFHPVYIVAKYYKFALFGSYK